MIKRLFSLNEYGSDMIVFEEKFASENKSIAEFLTVFKKKYLATLSNTPALRDTIEYVVMEAVDNAHEHGNNQDKNKSIVVHCRQEKDLLIFSVLDEGDGFAGKIPKIMPAISDLK